MDILNPTGSNMVEKVFTGPIQRQLRDALGFIKITLSKRLLLNLKFEMDENRSYLSVTIPVHPYFVPKIAVPAKESEYRKK